MNMNMNFNNFLKLLEQSVFTYLKCKYLSEDTIKIKNILTL